MGTLGDLRRKAHKGYILIEIIRSLGIIGFSLMGLTLLFTTGLGSSQHAALYSQAIYLAEGELEEVMLKPANTLASDTAYSREVDKVAYQIRLKTKPSESSSALIDYQIDVQWKESDGFHRMQLLTEGRGRP